MPSIGAEDDLVVDARRRRSSRRRGTPSTGSSRRAGPRPCAGSHAAAAGHRATGRSPSSASSSLASCVSSRPRPWLSSWSCDPLDQQVDDLGDLVLVSSWKTMTSSMRFRNSGRKCRLSSSCTLLLHLLVGDCLVGLAEADVRLAQVGGTEVRRHDDHGVLEVDRATLRVGEATVLQDLEERVEHVGVGLLDLVEEHDGERLAAHGLGELAAFVVADVARRRADEPRHRVLLHVLGHVELDQRRSRHRTGTRRASWRSRSSRHPRGRGR